jgi:hypothetical protein
LPPERRRIGKIGTCGNLGENTPEIWHLFERSESTLKAQIRDSSILVGMTRGS